MPHHCTIWKVEIDVLLWTSEHFKCLKEQTEYVNKKTSYLYCCGETSGKLPAAGVHSDYSSNRNYGGYQTRGGYQPRVGYGWEYGQQGEWENAQGYGYGGYGGNQEHGEICSFFKKGKCKYGDNCYKVNER